MRGKRKKQVFTSRKGVFSTIAFYFQLTSFLIPLISIFVFGLVIQTILLSLLAVVWVNVGISFKTRKMLGIRLSKKALIKIGIYTLILSFLIIYQVYFFGSTRIVLASSCPSTRYCPNTIGCLGSTCPSTVVSGSTCYYDLDTSCCYIGYSSPDTCGSQTYKGNPDAAYCGYAGKCTLVSASCPNICTYQPAGTCTADGSQCSPATIKCTQGQTCSPTSGCSGTGIRCADSQCAAGTAGACTYSRTRYYCNGAGSCTGTTESVNCPSTKVWPGQASSGDTYCDSPSSACTQADQYLNCYKDCSANKCVVRYYGCNGAGSCDTSTPVYSPNVASGYVCSGGNIYALSSTYYCSSFNSNINNCQWKVVYQSCGGTGNCDGPTLDGDTTTCGPGYASKGATSCTAVTTTNYCDYYDDCASDTVKRRNYRGCAGSGSTCETTVRVTSTTDCGAASYSCIDDHTRRYKYTCSGGTCGTYTSDTNCGATSYSCASVCTRRYTYTCSGGTCGTYTSDTNCGANTACSGGTCAGSNYCATGQCKNSSAVCSKWCDGSGGCNNWAEATCQDRDSSSSLCTQSSGGCTAYTWMSVAAKCCGDDGSTDMFENTGSGNPACVFGNPVNHNNIDSTSRYVAFNGELYYCKQAGGSGSGYDFVQNVNPGSAVGSWKCGQDGIWRGGTVIGIRGGRIRIV